MLNDISGIVGSALSAAPDDTVIDVYDAFDTVSEPLFDQRPQGFCENISGEIQPKR